ncbi:MAG: GGDEF domain-containing protein [Acidimicrobiales bacterium]
MAARHAVDGNVLHAATATTVGTGKASLVELVKSCDAELESLRRRLADPARRDPLTGLATRASLLDQLDLALARLSRQPNELALLFEDLIGPSEAKSRAEAFRKSAALPVSVAGSPVEITVSAGAVTVRLPGSRPEDVLARAGQAMNSARRAGDDQVNVVEVDRGRPLVVAERTVGHTTGSSA